VVNMVKYNDKLNMGGTFLIQTIDKETGKVEEEREIHNLIVTSGKNLVRDILAGDSSLNLTSFAFGTGSTAPTIGDTGLETAVPYYNSNIYKCFETYTQNSAQTIYEGWWASTEPVTQPVDLREIGLFTSFGATGGTMYCRQTFSALTKSTAIELKVEYTLDF